MQTIWKWLTLVLVVAEIALVRAGVLDISTAIGIVVLIEALLFIVVSRQIIVAYRTYRRNRSSGLDIWQAAEDGLTVFFPRRLAHLVIMEPQLWVAIWQWLRRRRLQTDEFTYHKKSSIGMLLIALMFSTPVEIFVFELLIPWEWLRWVFLILAIYAIIWFIGFYASLVTRPHRLGPDKLRLSYGLLSSATIPYAAIEGLDFQKRRVPGGNEGLKTVASEDAGYISIAGTTNITLRLRDALPLQGMLDQTAPVKTIHFTADQPDQMFQALQQRLETA
jgi:hypothetical protein